jgi:GNAT superfamily N-acetyltransferase
VAPATRIRTSRLGDIGWVLERHVVVYPKEFGYAPEFETYVAQSLIPFLERADPKRERLWIAEVDGVRVGSIAIHRSEKKGFAKLRWFLLEKEARGLGLGKKLMQTALRFARKAGYKGVHLFTVNDLQGARKVYEASGFTLAWQDTKPCTWAPWGFEQEWAVRF